jgi:phosphohistidine phosphatase
VTGRHLIVMRHAKAESFASSDHARALTERGRADALAAGRYLAGRQLVPQHAVISTAVRAAQTWEAVAEGARARAQVQPDGAVYTGSPSTVLEVLRTAPADAAVLVFVGHNPTAASLAHLLDDGEGDARAMHGLLRGYPAAALTVFAVAVPWASLGPEGGRLLDFHAPQG